MRGTSLPFLGLALLLTVVWVASPVIAQQVPPSMPGPRTIVAGKSLAGITIGAPIGAVVQRFGTPSAVIETDRDAVYVWHRFGVNAYVRDDLVTAVSTSNSLMRAGDIGPGFRVDDAIKAFGPTYQRGTVEGFQGLQFDEQGIAFGIDRKAVAVILVFAPGQAAQVSGLQRTAKLVEATVPIAPTITPLAPLAQVISGIPFVATQRAYSMVTNYMSLSGYLRWLVYQSSANWITAIRSLFLVTFRKSSRPRSTMRNATSRLPSALQAASPTRTFRPSRSGNAESLKWVSRVLAEPSAFMIQRSVRRSASRPGSQPQSLLDIQVIRSPLGA